MVKVSDFLAAKYVTVPRPARHWPSTGHRRLRAARALKEDLTNTQDLASLQSQTYIASFES